MVIKIIPQDEKKNKKRKEKCHEPDNGHEALKSMNMIALRTLKS
jgi:hypothetical protein